jgi:septal ring factor EnvC (AmiA/AmiB activator)
MLAVSPEAILGTVATVGAILTVLFGGGLFKQALHHNAEQAVQKHDIELTKIRVKEHNEALAKLTTEVALQHKDIQGFTEHVRKLEMLPEISSKLSTLEALLTYLKEQIKDFRTERMDHDKK